MLDQSVMNELSIYSQNALIGAITSNIRMIVVGLVEKTIQFVVIFDGEISEDDADNMSCVGTEIIANYNDLFINEQFLSIPYPERYIIPENHFCVYARKE